MVRDKKNISCVEPEGDRHSQGGAMDCQETGFHLRVVLLKPLRGCPERFWMETDSLTFDDRAAPGCI
jgi:hypothetical protein